jgi:tetratricopeptide (TPR) repeat protein
VEQPSPDDATLVAAPPPAASGSGAPPVVGAGELARGAIVGRFVVLELLGSGAMGHVYAAYDPQLDRRVAIKVLRDTGGGADARTRLLREAQALARIHHPNVIAVHEAGTFGDQVFLAMEFADGGTVRAWLAASPRRWPEIVRVFVQAGRGLAAAHAAGLVHRDIKPENLLMTRDGGVRVTDFGLVGRRAAEAVTSTAPPAVADPTSATSPLAADLTQTGAVMGTPAYMSPEQFVGATATDRSDQFAYCVALYEALYNQRPFRGAGLLDLAASVTSGQVELARPGAAVPGWLRRILIRGLSARPEARYPSMDALLAALRRAPSSRRRRWLVAGGLALALGAAGLALLVRPPPGARCDGGAARAAAVWGPARQAALAAAFAGSGRPLAGPTLAKVTAQLDGWARAWQLGHRDACEATRVRGEQSEHLLDLRMACLGRRLTEADATIGLLAAGDPETIDHALDAVGRLPALAECADVVGLGAAVAPPAPAARAAVEAVRAQIDGARAAQRLGRYAKARDLAQAAVAAAEGATYPPVVAEAQLTLAEAQLTLVDRAGIATARGAMHRAAQAGDLDTELAAAAQLVDGLATVTGQLELAQEVADLAAARVAGARPRAEIRVELANSRGLLAATRGRTAEAQARYEEALAEAEANLGPRHPATLTARIRLGLLLQEAGHADEARAQLAQVLAIRERDDGPDHPEVAGALAKVGALARGRGDFAEARRDHERALAIRVAALGPAHPDVGSSYNDLGALAFDEGDLPAAGRAFAQALAIKEAALGPDSLDLAELLSNVGAVAAAQGDAATAGARYERARALYAAVHGPDSPHVAMVDSNLGLLDLHAGRLDAALARFIRAEQITTRAYGPEHPDLGDYLADQGAVLQAQGKLDLAEAALTRAVAIAEKAHGADNPQLAMVLTNLAIVQAGRGEHEAALAAYRRALAIFEHKLGAAHPSLAYPLAGIGGSLVELHRAAEAVPYLERAVRLRVEAKAPSALTAEVRYGLAQALATAPATRARARAEAQAALAGYVSAKDAAHAADVRAWLASH